MNVIGSIIFFGNFHSYNPLKEIFYNKAFKKRLKCSFLFDGISTHGYKSSRERQDARKKWTFNWKCSGGKNINKIAVNMSLIKL